MDSIAAHPAVAVGASSTRHADAAAWLALDVPGSPYAVALDRDGTVLAKGTFNNLAQLESDPRHRRAAPGEQLAGRAGCLSISTAAAGTSRG